MKHKTHKSLQEIPNEIPIRSTERKKDALMGRIIDAFTLLAIVVADVVRVAFVEFIIRKLGRKSALPINERLLEIESEPFEEKAEQNTTIVTQVIIRLEMRMHIAHTKRKVLNKLRIQTEGKKRKKHHQSVRHLLDRR